MGLGKTLQTLALCLQRKPNWSDEVQPKDLQAKKQKLKQKGTVLVVTPVSVNVEWDDEIEKHCDGVN
jgi:SNF2 family DNA or RNA helicase